jgi:hypothetical protein
MKPIALTIVIAALGSSLIAVAADEPKQADAGAAFSKATATTKN